MEYSGSKDACRASTTALYSCYIPVPYFSASFLITLFICVFFFSSFFPLYLKTTTNDDAADAWRRGAVSGLSVFITRCYSAYVLLLLLPNMSACAYSIRTLLPSRILVCTSARRAHTALIFLWHVSFLKKSYRYTIDNFIKCSSVTILAALLLPRNFMPS